MRTTIKIIDHLSGSENTVILQKKERDLEFVKSLNKTKAQVFVDRKKRDKNGYQKHKSKNF